MNKMIRICPVCSLEIIHKNKISFCKSKKYNKPCVKCSRKEVSNRPEEREKNSKRQTGKRTGINNHFYNKNHTQKTKDLLKANAKVLKGKDNAMFGRSFYDVWVEKYGKDIADNKLIEYKRKKSISSKGELNSMYGKTSPVGSGNGWSGWYKGWYFRSLLELSYVVLTIERFGMNWKSAEYIKIPYTNYKGDKKTYSPDFIINNKYIIECKPKSLVKSPLVNLKSEAAILYCSINNLSYKIVSPDKIPMGKIKEMYINGDVKFIKKYEDKVKKLFNL